MLRSPLPLSPQLVPLLELVQVPERYRIVTKLETSIAYYHTAQAITLHTQE
jgi:hypothetical protein